MQPLWIHLRIYNADKQNLKQVQIDNLLNSGLSYRKLLFEINLDVYYLGSAAGADGRAPGADAAGDIILRISFL